MATSVDAKLLKQTKFPPEFNQKVDMKKVNVEVMKKWIAGKLSEILGSEDDVVIELCFNLLEGSRFPDIKVLQIQLTGFLDKDTAKFCKELWTLCLSAQSNAQGVPKELLEAKKLELIQEKIEAEKAAEEARRRKEQEKTRDRDIENIRQRERGERGRGRGRVGRGGRDFDRRGPRDSRSPPPRRRSPPDRSEFRGPPVRRDIDTYIPLGGRGGRRDENRRRRTRSPSARGSTSRSVTPPRHRRREHTEPRSARLRYSPDRYRSPSPDRAYGRRRGRTPDRGDKRATSFTPSDTSRSRSPRRYRRRRSPSFSSRSPTPSPRSKRTDRRRGGRSLSRSLSPRRERSGRPDRAKASYPHSDRYDADETRADYRKGRKYHQDRHRNRSPSRERHPRHRRSPSRSRSRSKSRSPRRERKHRSIERYAPVGKRRRNTSSVSSSLEKRRKRADSSADEASRQLPVRQQDKGSEEAERANPLQAGSTEESKPPIMGATITANALREKLLREKGFLDVVAFFLRSGESCRQPANREGIDTTHHELCQQVSFLISVLHMGALKEGLLPKLYAIPDKPQPELALPKAPPNKSTSPPPKKYSFRHGPYVRRIGETSQLLNHYDSKDKTPPKNHFYHRDGPCASGIEEISQLHNQYDQKPILTATINPRLLLKRSSSSSKKTPTALPITTDERGILDDDPTERPQATLLAEGHSDRLASEQKHVRKAKAVKRLRSTLDPDPLSGHEAFGPGYEADYAEQGRLQELFGAETLADQRPRPAIYGLSPVKLGPLLDLSPSPPPPPSPSPPSPPPASGAQVKATEDDQIYRMETAYLEETNAGNIIKGFDNYVKGSSTTGSNSANTASGVGGAANRRKGQILEQDRVFSRSSASFSRDSPPPDSATTTPSHAQTPSASFAPAQNGGAANLDTASNITTSTTNGNQKSGTAVKKNNKKASGQSVELEEDGDGGRNKRQKTG